MKDTHNNSFHNLYNNLFDEVKQRLQKLKELGMTDKEIASLLHTEQPLPKLTISKNYRLFLGENHVEVHMEPLVKAVYLLFLRHPDGIVFKCLPDYREELSRIYAELKPYGMNDRAIQSIEDVTNSTLNSINEKCARIRKIFSGVLSKSVASYYAISGKRGEAKKIALPRDLVVWE